MYLVLEMCHNGEMSRYLNEREMAFSEDEGQAELFHSDKLKLIVIGFVRFSFASCLPF